MEYQPVQKSQEKCISDYQEANEACDSTLRAEKFMLGGNYDEHYTRTRTEFAICSESSQAKFAMCQNYKRCQVRLLASKEECDKVYLTAAKAKIQTVRENFESMDMCYTKSLKLHWDCNDEVIGYEAYRNTCVDKKAAMVGNLQEKWVMGGPGSSK